MLPLSSDLKTLRLFLLENIANITNSKETPLSYSKWIQLQKLIVTQIITFNARRGGEPTNLKVEDWLEKHKWKREEDIKNIMDPMGKKWRKG